MQPETLFAEGPEGLVAYQMLGEGAIDLLFVPPWLWNIEVMWEEPRIDGFLRRLASFSRVIVFDKRGTGVSDPVPLGALPTLEQWTDDIRVVMDAAGSERAAIVGNIEGAQMALLFAAGHPERSSALVVIDGTACYLRKDDYPSGLPPHLIDRATKVIFGNRDDTTWLFAPSLMGDGRFRQWWGHFGRLGVSPTLAARMMRHGSEWDVRAALPTIHVPTMVIHRTGNQYTRVENGRYIASHVEGARIVEIAGEDAIFFGSGQAEVVGEIQAFLTGMRDEPEHDRVLATVLFTDVVNSTERAAAIGDRRWHELLDAHDRLASDEIERYRGKLIKTTGDGVLATFDGPARAIRCSAAIADMVRRLGLEIRAGLHTGEVELRAQDVGGIAVNLAARIMGEATSNEILVSSTVKDLVIGSGIEFDERAARELKGVPGEWRLYAAKP